MNLAFALDHIPRRMHEMGFGDNYLTRYRHFIVKDKKTVIISAHNQYWYFIEPEGLKIESERGVFDMDDTTINMQQHEHSGKIKIVNATANRDMWILFIQVIPQHKKNVR
jgi:hypothetical protein